MEDVFDHVVVLEVFRGTVRWGRPGEKGTGRVPEMADEGWELVPVLKGWVGSGRNKEDCGRMHTYRHVFQTSYHIITIF